MQRKYVPLLLSQNRYNYIFSVPALKSNKSKKYEHKVLFVGSAKSFNRILLLAGIHSIKNGKGKAVLVKGKSKLIPSCACENILIPDYVKVEEIRNKRLLKRIDNAAIKFAGAIGWIAELNSPNYLENIDYKTVLKMIEGLDKVRQLGFGEVGIVGLVHLVNDYLRLYPNRLRTLEIVK